MEYLTVDFHIKSARNAGKPVRVGWFMTDDKSTLVLYPPEQLDQNCNDSRHVANSRFFCIRCPYDLNIGFGRDAAGKPHIINRAGTTGGVRSNKLGSLIHLVNENEWRYPGMPIIQLSLPYCFVCEETCYITQLDAFGHYRPTPLPGTIFGGRFPIHAWVRPLMWAFEWHDTTHDLVLKRGEPLFYCQFEGDRPDRQIDLIRAKRTPEIDRWISSMQGVASLMNQTFSLFKAAEAARPRPLIFPED